MGYAPIILMIKCDKSFFCPDPCLTTELFLAQLFLVTRPESCGESHCLCGDCRIVDVRVEPASGGGEAAACENAQVCGWRLTVDVR